MATELMRWWWCGHRWIDSVHFKQHKTSSGRRFRIGINHSRGMDRNICVHNPSLHDQTDCLRLPRTPGPSANPCRIQSEIEIEWTAARSLRHCRKLHSHVCGSARTHKLITESFDGIERQVPLDWIHRCIYLTIKPLISQYNLLIYPLQW